MKEETLVDKIAISLGIKPAQLKTADVHAKIPSLRRTAEDYERQAVAAEAASLENRAKAFSPDTPAADRAKYMRQSSMDAQRAKTLAGFAGTFLTQLGNYTALETTMQIADEMKSVGLLSSDVSAMDWQKAMDSMQSEIQRIIATNQKLGDVMGSVLSESSSDAANVADELDALFKKWEAETDPVKKAEIQRIIDTKCNAALA